GLAAANSLGVSGAVLQMFSHGIIGALLFAIAGRMIYARTHTRDLHELSHMNLSRVMPFVAFVFVVASAASMGIPGFSGFAAEITILIGAWKSYSWAVWITGIGMVLVAAFTLRAVRLAFFGERHLEPPMPIDTRITLPEKFGAAILIFATLAVGIYPKLLLDRIQPAVQAMRFLQ
nr:NADH-quinone oxidoreductase subunit M [Verrucomicrobiota bacterium]